MLPVLLVAFLAGLRRQDAARRAATTSSPLNPGTGLPNRAALFGQVAPALARSRREDVPCSVIAAAVDGLAEIEEQRGPGAVAEVLRDFATAFRDATRAGDVAGHLRPQVLGALLPGAEAARTVGDRLREEISVRLPHPAMDGRRLTVSIGISLVGGGPASAALDEAFAASEAALVAARRAGGDQVMVAEPPPMRTAEPV
nr:GGDEF domain-containing protein [Neoroseomonas soli]